MTNKHQNKGFTLIEMLLVLVIMSGIIYIASGYLQQRAISLRIDRTSAQMQQILSAGMSYYISNNQWPAGTVASPATLDGSSVLQTQGYLPTSMPSPWAGSLYQIYSNSTNFYVQVTLPAATNNPSMARVIVGTLPLAFTSNTANAITASACAANQPCYVVATVNIPSQSLNGAAAVNFAGMYHSGACVPAPASCPANYKPEAFAVPVAVNGFYSGPSNAAGDSSCTATNTAGCKMTYYPLNGYTAYTTTTDPVDYTKGTNSSSPLDCGNAATTHSGCFTDSTNSTSVESGKYWRVCISVTTSSGNVAPNNTNGFQNPWGQLTGTVMVMTRCMPGTENQGSNFTVWGVSTPGGT